MSKNAIDSSVVVKNIESKLKELKLSKAEFYRDGDRQLAVAVYAVPAVLKKPQRVAPRRGYTKGSLCLPPKHSPGAQGFEGIISQKRTKE